MGLFDFFKRKEQKDALNAYLEEMQNKMFPGGKQEIARQVREVASLLDNKYELQEVSQILLYMSSLMFTAQDKSAERVVRIGAMNRPNNIFSEKSLMTIYKYVVRQQFVRAFKTDNEQMFNEFYKSLGNVEDGATTDVIPGAYGDYGLCATNPIPVRGVPANEIYLNSLELLSGEGFSWTRIGSTSAPNISRPIDIYKIITNKGDEICRIYISPYQNVISKKAPRGFAIKK